MTILKTGDTRQKPDRSEYRVRPGLKIEKKAKILNRIFLDGKHDMNRKRLLVNSFHQACGRTNLFQEVELKH